MNYLYLCHHGVKDQRKGVRNAPWYSIAAYFESLKNKLKNGETLTKTEVKYITKNKDTKEAREVEKLAGADFDGDKVETEKEKKRTAPKVSAEKRAEAAAKAKATREHKAEIERIKKDGTAEEVIANKSEFTNEELTKALQRLTTEASIKRLVETPKETSNNTTETKVTKTSKVENAVKFAKGAANALNTVSDLYDSAARVHNALLAMGVISGDRWNKSDYVPKQDDQKKDKPKTDDQKKDKSTASTLLSQYLNYKKKSAVSGVLDKAADISEKNGIDPDLTNALRDTSNLVKDKKKK